MHEDEYNVDVTDDDTIDNDHFILFWMQSMERSIDPATDELPVTTGKKRGFLIR